MPKILFSSNTTHDNCLRSLETHASDAHHTTGESLSDDSVISENLGASRFSCNPPIISYLERDGGGEGVKESLSTEIGNLPHIKELFPEVPDCTLVTMVPGAAFDLNTVNINKHVP